MRRKNWVLMFIAITLSWISYNQVQKNEEQGNVLNNIHQTDLIVVRDGSTSDELLSLRDSDAMFSDLKNSYTYIYPLKRSERSVLLGDAVYEIAFHVDNEEKFTIDIYKANDSNIDFLPTISRHKYSPEDRQSTYIFALTNLNQLIERNESLIELLTILENESILQYEDQLKNKNVY